MKTITIKRQLHHGQNRLTLNFEFEKDLISIIKTIDDARWSSTMKSRHVPDDNDIYPYNYKELTDDKISL